MRFHGAVLTAAVLVGSAASASAQDQVRLMINAGQQASSMKFTQNGTFQQYVEQGMFAMDRTIRRRPFYDGGAAVRVAGRFNLGASISFFKDAGSGTLTAQVPHPFVFNQMRTTTAVATGAERKETALHIQASWTERAAGGIEFTAFGGPTIFQTEQGLVTRLNLTLADEVYPYDTLQTFPGVTTEVVKSNVTGYNAGVDMTWKLDKNLGLGVLVRYSHGSKNVTSTGGQAVKIDTGGLHAGGGLRVIF